MTLDAAGFLRKTAERLRDGSIDAATAAQRIEDVVEALNEKPNSRSLQESVRSASLSGISRGFSISQTTT